MKTSYRKGVRVVTMVLVVITLGWWLLQGFYVVGPSERAVVRLFGKVVTQAGPGLAYRLPWPLQTHDLVDVASIRRLELGFRSQDGRSEAVPTESLMLTVDENLVQVQLFAQYLVRDPVKFLFHARDPEVILPALTEAAVRSVVGQNSIDYILSEGRVDVQAQTSTYLQELLDAYETGVRVIEARLLTVEPPQQVRDIFDDVFRAREDSERLIQEARGYRADVVPKARGEAAQMLQRAEAYKAQRVIRAQGDAVRFLTLLEEYNKAQEVTRDRLYLESLTQILPKARKFILRSDGITSGVLPMLPLGALTASGEQPLSQTATTNERK
ncbi:MAG: FtsH protease activity modulator HflK [Candidatus Binatia bacterium]